MRNADNQFHMRSEDYTILVVALIIGENVSPRKRLIP